MLSLSDRGGQGSPLILIHGFLGTGDDWLPVLPGLTELFHCYTIDLPGHGRSCGQRAASLQDCAGQVYQTLSAAGLLPAAVLGYSLGGRISLALAEAYPQALSQLFLEGANPGLTDEKERRARLKHDSEWAARFGNEDLQETLRHWYQQPVFASLTESARRNLITERMRNADPAALASILQGCSLGVQPDWRGMINRLKTTVVYFAGEHDRKFRALAADLARCSGSEHNGLFCVQIVAGAGHNTHRDAPAAFVGAMRDVLPFSNDQKVDNDDITCS